MSNTISIRNLTQAAGKNLSDVRTITTDNILDATEALTAGKAGTAGADGVMTLGSHGLTDANVVAVTWSGGIRYGCTISTYDGTTVTLTGGAGDALPTSGAVVVAAQVEIDAAFNGSNLDYLFLGCDVAAIICLEDAGGVELYVTVTAGGAYSWDSGTGVANPVTGDSIIKATCYNQGTTAGSVQIFAGYDND